VTLGYRLSREAVGGERRRFELDAAVAAAYGWPADINADDALRALLSLNRARQPEAQVRRGRH
jgi:hypothetical protein